MKQRNKNFIHPDNFNAFETFLIDNNYKDKCVHLNKIFKQYNLNKTIITIYDTGTITSNISKEYTTQLLKIFKGE